MGMGQIHWQQAASWMRHDRPELPEFREEFRADLLFEGLYRGIWWLHASVEDAGLLRWKKVRALVCAEVVWEEFICTWDDLLFLILNIAKDVILDNLVFNKT